MAENANLKEVEDPCGSYGPEHKWAVVWFLVFVVGGGYLTYEFARIDRWMRMTNAEVLDYQAYSENRTAFTTIGAEGTDPRAFGGYSTQVEHAREAALPVR